MRNRYLEILVDLAEETYGVEIKKNSELQQLMSTEGERKGALKLSVKGQQGSAGRATTKQKSAPRKPQKGTKK
jgi:hypothetical protein